jgi:CheY-like chemotaxis protein
MCWVMDVQMPELTGVDAAGEISRVAPGVAVLMLTMFDDDYSVLAAMRAGARGYVLKGAQQDEIVRANIPSARPPSARTQGWTGKNSASSSRRALAPRWSPTTCAVLGTHLPGGRKGGRPAVALANRPRDGRTMRKLDKRHAHRADGAPGSARWRFRRSETLCEVFTFGSYLRECGRVRGPPTD